MACRFCKKEDHDGKCTIVYDIAKAIVSNTTNSKSGNEGLREIVTTVNNIEELEQLGKLDLSNCTKQTKYVANQNLSNAGNNDDDNNIASSATSASSSATNNDHEGDAEENNDSTNTPTFIPPHTLVELIAITILFASSYVKNDTEKGKQANNENYHWPFYLFLCGVVNIDYPSFFPSPNANAWEGDDSNSGNANYIDGCLYTCLAQAMPLAMANIISGVESYPRHLVNIILLWFYTIGYIDGDGTYSGQFDGKQRPKCTIAIHTVEHVCPYVHLLKRELGFKYYQSSGIMKLNMNYEFMYESLWFLASHLCQTIKRLQVIQLIKTAAVTQIANIAPNIDSEDICEMRKYQTGLLSAANNEHAVQFEQSYFESLFTKMIESSIHPLSFFASSAGMIGSDGGVGYRLSTCLLCQSCENYCNAFANACQQGLGLEDAPVVREKNDSSMSTNTRAKFDVVFDTWQSVFCILYFGSFDYRRRCQWLVFLLAVLIKEAPPFQNRDNVIVFLDDLIKVIRKEEKS